VWWENSPLVIQEAFPLRQAGDLQRHRRHGEKVRAGVDGLHFRSADPRSLAEVIRTAAETPGLWDRLHDGIRPSTRWTSTLTTLGRVYTDLLVRQPKG